MAGEITQTELQNAKLDAITLAQAVTTNATITPRTGSAFSSIPKLVADKGADLDAETANAAAWATSLTVVADGLKGSRGYAQDAATSATAAQDALDEFNFRYLGARANDAAAEAFAGAELDAGDFYFRLSDNVQRYYTGAGWVTTGAPIATVGISDGGTGATTAAAARAALDVPGLSVRNRFTKRPTINAERFDYEAYDPTVTRVAVSVGHGDYRHVPSIAVKDTGQLLGAYLYNTGTDVESASGQTATFIRSSNNGDTWSSAVDELNSSTYTDNALDPVGDSAIQGEVFVYYDPTAGEEIATVTHRSGSFESAFFAVRDASAADPSVDKWTAYRYAWDSTSNDIELTTDTTGAAPSGKKLTYTIDGTEYDCFGFKPFKAHTGPLEGKLIVPLLFITTFGGSHRIGFAIHDADDRTSVSMGGVVPIGEVPDGGAWEPTTWQLPDGSFMALCRNVDSSAISDKLAQSVSADLYSWSPLADADADVHNNRHIRVRVDDTLYLGVGTSHDSNRNHLTLFASGDGYNYVHGLKISDETDGNDFAQYSDIEVRNGTVYVLYSEDNTTGTTAPDEIRFARFDAPTSGELPIMAGEKGVYELDSGTAPSFSGDILTVPPQMIASATPIGNAAVYTFRARVDTAPNSNPYQIVSVGDEQNGYFSIEVRNNGGTAELWAGGVKIEDFNDETQFRDYAVAVDLTRGFVSALGQQARLSRRARIYFGDTDTDSGGAQAGNILIDVAGCYATRYDSDNLLALFAPEKLDRDFAAVTAESVTSEGDVIAGSSTAGNTDVTVSVGTGSTGTLRFQEGGATKGALFLRGSDNDMVLQGRNAADSANVGVLVWDSSAEELLSPYTFKSDGSLVAGDGSTAGNRDVAINVASGDTGTLRFQEGSSTKAALFLSGVDNDLTLQGRNSADSGNVEILNWDSFAETLELPYGLRADADVVVGDGSTAGDLDFIINVASGSTGTLRFQEGGATKGALFFNGTSNDLVLQGRNAADSANVNVFAWDSSDEELDFNYTTNFVAGLNAGSQELGPLVDAHAQTFNTTAADIEDDGGTALDFTEGGTVYEIIVAQTGGADAVWGLVLGNATTPQIITQSEAGGENLTLSVSGTNIQVATATASRSCSVTVYKKAKA